MKVDRRKMGRCERIVESFLTENPRFGSDGWAVQSLRENNGGDAPYHTGPFRGYQLYLNLTELMATYQAAGLDVYSTSGMEPDDMYFPVVFGALMAFRKSDGSDPGWVYSDEGWKRCGCANGELPTTNDEP